MLIKVSASCGVAPWWQSVRGDRCCQDVEAGQIIMLQGGGRWSTLQSSNHEEYIRGGRYLLILCWRGVAGGGPSSTLYSNHEEYNRGGKAFFAVIQ